MRYWLTVIIFLLLWSACDLRTERMQGYAVHGIDISHYQSYVNWDTLAQQNIQFAFVKATEGMTLVDSIFCHNWAEMERVGLKRGAYHFFRPTIPADIQARNFIDMVDIRPGDLPPVLDIEVLDGVSNAQLLDGVRMWLNLVEAHYNIKPVLYTYHKFYNRHLAGQFKNYPLWLARYNDSRQPTLADGSQWDFWQYGNRGRIKGVQGDVDLNVFRGSLSELEDLCLSPPVVLSEKWSQRL
ncbi:MAG: glycoside hydrolase family 25 protein [Saprospiraceae bacterium]